VLKRVVKLYDADEQRRLEPCALFPRNKAGTSFSLKKSPLSLSLCVCVCVVNQQDEVISRPEAGHEVVQKKYANLVHPHLSCPHQ